jgi:mRNA-degrading endonuclease toxin of MazEF toxin-antitoxin module
MGNPIDAVLPQSQVIPASPAHAVRRINLTVRFAPLTVRFWNLTVRPDGSEHSNVVGQPRSLPGKHINRVQDAPLSSQVDRLYPSEAIVTLNGKTRKAMADQLTTVSKLRLSHREGHLSAADLAQIERVVKLQLDLKP